MKIGGLLGIFGSVGKYSFLWWSEKEALKDTVVNERFSIYFMSSILVLVGFVALSVIDINTVSLSGAQLLLYIKLKVA